MFLYKLCGSSEARNVKVLGKNFAFLDYTKKINVWKSFNVKVQHKA